MFYLCFLPSAFVYSQSGADSVCSSHIENIFKVRDFKIRHDAVQYFYQKNNPLSFMSKEELSRYFELIGEFPIGDIEELKVRKDSTSASDISSEYIDVLGVKSEGPVIIEMRSVEEMNRYREQLNCPPAKAHKEYRDLIQQIKSEKEIYLQCLDAELAKGNSSEYAKVRIIPYEFRPPGSSFSPIPRNMTKLDFLKVFKEFIFNDDRDDLPQGFIVHVYLKCNCKFP
jgi:hypothetical protein